MDAAEEASEEEAMEPAAVADAVNVVQAALERAVSANGRITWTTVASRNRRIGIAPCRLDELSVTTGGD